MPPQRAAILLFVVYLIIGFAVVGDYGISTDESQERQTSLANYAYVMERLMNASDNESVQRALSSAPRLYDWRDRYYGVALQTVTVLLEHMRGFEMTTREIFVMRHVFTFLNYFAAGIFFYLILRRRFGNTYIPLLGVLIFILNPRFFGGSFYNIKDMLYLSWIIISAYFVLRWLEDEEKKTFMIPAAFTLAIATNTRILGISILLLAGGFAFIQGLYRVDKFAQYMKNTTLLCVLTFVFFVIVTPFLWANPLKNTIDMFFHYMWFQPWDGTHFYLGEMIRREVPWHYIPVWAGLTIPLLYQALFLVGIIVIFAIKIRFGLGKVKPFLSKLLEYIKPNCKKIRAIPENENIEYGLPHLYDMFFTAMFVFTILGFIGLRISMYVGWRHAYGIVPSFLFLAVFGLHWISSYLSIKRKVMEFGFACIVGISLLHSLAWTVINHPYQYVYFNVIGRQFAEEKFELDYWGVSITDIYFEMLRNDNRSHITVGVVGAHGSFAMLPPEYQARLSTRDRRFAPDYIVMGTRGHISSRGAIDGYEEVFYIMVDGFRISGLHRYLIQPAHFDATAYRLVQSITVSNNEDYALFIIDSDRQTAWQTEGARQEEDYVILQFVQPVNYNLIRLNTTNTNLYSNNIVISVSLDGEDWDTPFIVFNNSVDYVFAPSQYQYIRLENRQGHQDHAWGINEIEFGNIYVDIFDK